MLSRGASQTLASGMRSPTSSTGEPYSEQQPPSARRPGNVAEATQAAEYGLLAPERVGLGDEQLAPQTESPYDGDPMVVRCECRVHEAPCEVEGLDAATAGIEDDECEAPAGEPADNEEPCGVGGPLELCRPRRDARRGPERLVLVGLDHRDGPAAVGVGQNVLGARPPGRRDVLGGVDPTVAGPVPSNDAEIAAAQVRDPEAAGRPAGIVDVRPGERPANLALRRHGRELVAPRDADEESPG